MEFNFECYYEMYLACKRESNNQQHVHVVGLNVQNKRWIELINKWAFDSRPNNRPKVRQTTCFLFVFCTPHNIRTTTAGLLGNGYNGAMDIMDVARPATTYYSHHQHRPRPNVVRYVVDHHRPILGDRFQIAARAAAIQLRT
jgi:hypothetical protein